MKVGERTLRWTAPEHRGKGDIRAAKAFHPLSQIGMVTRTVIPEEGK